MPGSLFTARKFLNVSSDNVIFSEMADKDKRRLIFSIVQFLNGELGSDLISEDAKEGLEVASQCLQTAYCMASEDTHLEVSRTLFDIFVDATKNEPVSHLSYLLM